MEWLANAAPFLPGILCAAASADCEAKDLDCVVVSLCDAFTTFDTWRKASAFLNICDGEGGMYALIEV